MTGVVRLRTSPTTQSFATIRIYQVLVGEFTSRFRTDYDWTGIDTEAENRNCGGSAGRPAAVSVLQPPYGELRRAAHARVPHAARGGPGRGRRRKGRGPSGDRPAHPRAPQLGHGDHTSNVVPSRRRVLRGCHASHLPLMVFLLSHPSPGTPAARRACQFMGGDAAQLRERVLAVPTGTDGDRIQSPGLGW